MIRKGLFLLLAASGFILLFSSCGPKPTCSVDALVAPVLGNPPMWETVGSLSPTLTWSYPDSSCVPESYVVHLNTGPFFGDELGGGTGSPITSWVPGIPLQPGTEYAWGIQAVVGTTLGPYAGNHYFFTGPECDAASLAAPILLKPVNGEYIDTLTPSLKWDYPDPCVPEAYIVDLSTDPAFTDTSLSGSTGGVGPSTRWGPGDPLTDCTRYYWRVAPYDGLTTGPFSGIYTFRVETTTCALEETGVILGKVWHDLCALPELGPIPDPLPTGCKWLGGGVQANGIYEPAEPGIADVVVRLGWGPCPAIDHGAVLTNVNGNFAFYELPAGTYCVSVDALEASNVSVLIPGGWTAPAGGISGDVASWNVSVGEVETVSDINFGWDYQFAPGYGEMGTVSGIVWHDLCVMNPGDLPSDPLPDGCIVDEWGVVHADGIRQPDEPGLESVSVEIGPGDCPSTGLATAMTDSDGRYNFVGLPASDYCIAINAEASPLLLPGRWTMVPSGHEGWTYRAITLSAGESLVDQDFGWDYENLPLNFSFIANAHCRLGPTLRYQIMEWIPAGEIWPAIGRNHDGTWVLLQGKGFSCWSALRLGLLDGEILSMPVIIPPPEPIEEPSEEEDSGLAPVDCSQFTDTTSCNQYSNQGCTWVTQGANNPRGYCSGP